MNDPNQDQREQRLVAVEKRLSEIDLLLLQLELLQDIKRRVIELEDCAGPDSFGVENKLSINGEGKIE